jgi:hypothetical protein
MLTKWIIVVAFPRLLWQGGKLLSCVNNQYNTVRPVMITSTRQAYGRYTDLWMCASFRPTIPGNAAFFVSQFALFFSVLTPFNKCLSLHPFVETITRFLFLLDSIVDKRLATDWTVRRSNPDRSRFFAPSLTGLAADPAYKMGTGSFPGGKRSGCSVDHPPHLAPRLKEE